MGGGLVSAAVEAAVAAGGGEVMPGLIFNLKKKVDMLFSCCVLCKVCIIGAWCA
jgi:hypothetical protein